MASSLNKYAQNIARARYATPTIPATGIRSSRSKISAGGSTPAAGAPAAKADAPEMPKVPTGEEPGEPTKQAEAYNPIIDAETENAPVDPNRQEAIANQARAPRFAIGNPGVGSIDLGSLLSAKPTEGFDPKAPIGGANVPFQETKGVGGFFRRMFGDTANEQNVASQQAQAAEWKASDLEQQKEDRLIKRMQEADKPQALRFERQLAENKAIREGEQTTRKAERKEDRADRLKREADDAERQRQEREDRLTQWREENAIKDAIFGQNQLKSNQPQMIGLSGGGMGIFEPRSGSVSIVNPGTAGFGTMPGTPPVTRQVYPQPKAPVNTGGGAQVNRTDGSTMGAGPLPPDAGAAMTPPQVTPMRAAAPSPEADASLLGRFKSAMPSLSFVQPSGRGYQVAPLTEGDVAQQAMEQIAYPLRAAVAEEAKGEFENPQAAFSVLSRPPAMRLRKPSSIEMSEARKAGDLIRQMYAE